LDGKSAWIFHGDVFDVSIQNAKWIAKLGGWGYDMLIWLNRVTNTVLDKFGFEPYSLSKKIKNSVKEAVKFINDFENTAAELAIDNGHQYVICGHIHQPQIKEVENKKGKTLYLNSGDWVENLTALEYDNAEWTIYHHPRKKADKKELEEWQDITTESLIAGLLTPEIDA
jgi:UDP-2,3-diacylglucosamine pyrophosphatase LpxH